MNRCQATGLTYETIEALNLKSCEIERVLNFNDRTIVTTRVSRFTGRVSPVYLILVEAANCLMLRIMSHRYLLLPGTRRSAAKRLHLFAADLLSRLTG